MAMWAYLDLNVKYEDPLLISEEKPIQCGNFLNLIWNIGNPSTRALGSEPSGHMTGGQAKPCYETNQSLCVRREGAWGWGRGIGGLPEP